MPMDRRELADYLRRSRERLRPHEAGLPSGPRRRTPGLRREEVSRLAGMSAENYIRLEQARGPQPSPRVLASLARALRMTEDERDRLYLLAGHRPPDGPQAADHVSPGLQHLLDRLSDTPGRVLGDLGDVLAQNTMAGTLLGQVHAGSEHGRNLVWRWFSDPDTRRVHPREEHDFYSRLHVAELRAAVARRPADDPAAVRLVRRLRTASEEFSRLWERPPETDLRRPARVRVLHPLIGPVVLDCETLLAPEAGQRLVVLTPPPGSDAAGRLALLRTIGDGRAPWPSTAHPH
ncbi:helix-turn-helix transcriptional regulator [Streptomyces sp. YIM 98790]|uniref:helix-turn-helix transcriptional regulator n=1 Tax=Streptomyces sp. YIM 98790 TaxID=2689077 RepID=UPI00140C63EC|nr:helix-turn-helix transcriptional regulator [Streptomyces sp. YIM 98790]